MLPRHLRTQQLDPEEIPTNGSLLPSMGGDKFSKIRYFS